MSTPEFAVSDASTEETAPSTVAPIETPHLTYSVVITQGMYEAGEFVAEYVDPVSTEQIQPNGVDLTLGQITRQTTPGRIARTGKTIGERTPVSPAGDPPTYALSPGGYIAQYAETIEIPRDHVGFIYPRSSLMRNSGMLNTAVWDAGYTGRGEGLLQIYHDIELEQGARIAQLVLARAEHTTAYDGTYQHENLDIYLDEKGHNR